jgi:UDPglucose--hexose-1-phosphate uridylyltransferase
VTDAFRFDELTGGWVAIAPGRVGAWTHLRGPAEMPAPAGRCPFCPGHEGDTEETIARLPDDGPWRVRVVNNLFPLATVDAVQEPIAGGIAAAARGAHEVVVEHPEHALDLPDYDVAHLADVLRVYRDRVRALRALRGVWSVGAFRNRGRRAGSSQPHPHGQIVASPVPAPEIERRFERARAAYEADGRPLLESILERELESGERVVEATEHFAVVCPFAPRQSHHAMIVPRAPRGDFADASDDTIEALAPVLRATVRRTRAVTNDGPYNLVFRTPPVHGARDPAATWHIDVLPRRGGGAGFELATGIDVVTVTPEESARLLRAAAP